MASPDAPPAAPSGPPPATPPATPPAGPLALFGWVLALMLLGLGTYNLLQGDRLRGAGMLLILPVVVWQRLPRGARAGGADARAVAAGVTPLDRTTVVLLVLAALGVVLYLTRVVLGWVA